MRSQARSKTFWLGLGWGILGALVVAAAFAPEFLSRPNFKARALSPFEVFPLGTDNMGRPLWEYALQGADIVILPAVVAGLLVMLLATIAGLARCADFQRLDSVLQAFSELVGALPRLVVILVVAGVLPLEMRTLMPIAVTWAILASPGAMDEAATSAGRLGGAHFVEALRAHGFSAPRIYLYHVVWLNLRSVLVRQGAEIIMQVVFLEIALSYLSTSDMRPAMTHSDASYSWAELLYQGYVWLIGAGPMWYAMVAGLVLVALVAIMAQAFRLGARAR